MIPQLQVFSPASELSEHSTLSELYERAFKPLWLKPKQCDPKTFQVYEDALAHWKKLAPDPDDPARREPALVEIDDFVVARFLSGLAELPGNKPGSKMSIGTISKHATQINKLLSFAGPRERTTEGYLNRGIMQLPPLVEKPRADWNPPEGDFNIEEVHAMWNAAIRMCVPKIPGITPSDFWRSIITVASLTGLRRGQLLGLCYDDLEGQYITVRSSRSKGRRGKKQFLRSEAFEALTVMARGARPDSRIFHWPYRSKGQTNVRYLDLQLERLVVLAGIPPHRRFAWNGFRKLAATGGFEIAGAKGSAAILGHAREGTGLAHYVSGMAQARKAAEVINLLPSPRPIGDDSRQSFLF